MSVIYLTSRQPSLKIYIVYWGVTDKYFLVDLTWSHGHNVNANVFYFRVCSFKFLGRKSTWLLESSWCQIWAVELKLHFRKNGTLNGFNSILWPHLSFALCSDCRKLILTVACTRTLTCASLIRLWGTAVECGVGQTFLSQSLIASVE